MVLASPDVKTATGSGFTAGAGAVSRLIRPSLPADPAAIAPHLRAEDVAEVWASNGWTPLEALEASARNSAVCWTMELDGAPAAMYGAVPTPDIPGYAAVWFLGGDALTVNRVWFLRACRASLPDLVAPYRVAFNMVDQRYTAALRWMEWLGFQCLRVEPAFGFERRPFALFAIRGGLQ